MKKLSGDVMECGWEDDEYWLETQTGVEGDGWRDWWVTVQESLLGSNRHPVRPVESVDDKQ